jgi:hypothetical protein
MFSGVTRAIEGGFRSQCRPGEGIAAGPARSQAVTKLAERNHFLAL